MASSDASRAGTAVFAGAVQFAVFLIMAQALYPDYSIHGNYISDLGATCDSLCVVSYPASTIFTASVILLGVFLVIGAYFFRRAFHSRVVPAMVVMTAVGAIGVGLFSEAFGAVHALFSFIAFLFAGLTALCAFRYQRAPMNYFSIMLGAATLGALALYIPRVFLGLGPGGMESMVVYPVVLWGVAFGAHLMGTASLPDPSRQQ